MMEYLETDLIPKQPAPLPVPERLQPMDAAPQVHPGLFFRQCICSALLCCFLLSMKLWYPAGAERMRELLTARELGAAEQAMETMLTNLLDGESFSDAIVVFCQGLVHGENPD